MTDEHDNGASLRDRAGGLRPEPAAQSQPEALIPSADGYDFCVDHPSVFIAEELAARGWDKFDLATHMGGDINLNVLVIDLYFTVGPERTNMRIGERTAWQLAIAFGTSVQLFLNLEQAWLRAQGIEAGTAKTAGLGAQHESPTPTGDAPAPIRPSRTRAVSKDTP